MKKDIIIVGVGGQGILLTSKILGYLALKMGDDVKVSEVHGMSQRGGSVITHVRIGQNVASPLVTPGEADLVISFEWLEALRAEFYLKPEGAVIANTRRMLPMPVIMGKAEYPERQITGRPVYALDPGGLRGGHRRQCQARHAGDQPQSLPRGPGSRQKVSSF